MPPEHAEQQTSSLMPSLLDREISSEDDDAFGHRHFARALQGLIESPSNQPPFSIGLLGKWGTGKSSVKAVYMSALADDRSKAPDGTRRADRFHAITFNAWRFGGENIKRALLRHVYLELGGEKRDIRDELFHNVTRTTRESRSWSEIWQEARDRFIAAPLQVVVILLSCLTIITVACRVLHIGAQGSAAVIGLFITIGFPSAVAAIWKVSPVSLMTPVTRVELPRTSAEEYEDLLVAQLRMFANGKGKRCQRIVIFVDDLDRLSAEEMVTGLDAIRTFMDLSSSQLPEHLGIVFVISCDEDRIAAALADRRRRGGQDLPGSVLNRSDAHRYLDRIFQFRLEIPPFPKQDMRNYALDRLQKDLPGIADAITAHGGRLEEIVERMIHIGVQSPRNAVQILNAFSESWWIAAAREREGAGSDRPGGLQEGSVTRHPEALAALSALRVDFPDFYSDLQKEPGLIRYFADVFMGGAPLEQLPANARELLQHYGHKDDKEPEVMRLDSDQWTLRQYIASLQELRFPPSLQPLLLLSQDPISRRYGDRERLLYDAVVSGDTQGTLAALGREYDNNPLTEEDIKRLRLLNEDLAGDVASRRNNAAFVIADLMKRMPSDAGQLALVPVARQAVSSPDLRWRLGIDRIRDMLPRVRSEDRRELAAALIDDLLKPSDELVARTPQNEEPSLDEAREMTRAAVSLALSVREGDRLPTRADDALIAWLAIRHVGVHGESVYLPFSDLDEWLAVYEASLLPALRGRYATLVAEEVETGRLHSPTLDLSLRRVRTVFDLLVADGPERRVELWALLSRFIRLQPVEAVQLAAEVMAAQFQRADTSSMSGAVRAFAIRLDQDMSGGEWALSDWKELSGTFLAILDRRLQDISNEASHELEALAISWGGDDATAELAVRLVELMRKKFPSEASTVLTDWCSKPLTDLGDAVIAWIGRHWTDILNDDQRQSLVASLERMRSMANVSEDEGKHYRLLTESLPDDSRDSTELSAHLQNALTQVMQQYALFDAYVKPVFPALVPVLHLMDQNFVSSRLHSLFENSRSQLLAYGWLHQQMTGYWPDSVTDGYSPDPIVPGAVAVLRQYPTDPSVSSVLRSLTDMLRKGLLPTSRVSEIADAAVDSWSTFPSDAISVWEAAQVRITPERLVRLGQTADFTSEQSAKALLDAWTLLKEQLSDDERFTVLIALLNDSARGTAAAPDLALRVWVDAMGSERGRFLAQAMRSEGLNDDQLRRVWLQIVAHASELGASFVGGLLPDMLATRGSRAVGLAILESRDAINLLFPQTTDRNRLGRMLLGVLGPATSGEVKNGIAAWIAELGKGVLRSINDVPGLDEGDIDLLESRIGDSPYLDRWRKHHANDPQ